MTDDIVLYLRASRTRFNRHAEAADEIERLRSEVSRLMQIICYASPDDDYLLVRQECDAIWEQIHKDNQAVRGDLPAS